MRKILLLTVLLGIAAGAYLAPAHALVWGIPFIQLATSTVVSNLTIGAAVASLMGAAAMYIDVPQVVLSEPAPAVRVRINPKSPHTVPEGWSAGSSAGDPPVPPSAASATTQYRYSLSGGSIVGSWQSTGQSAVLEFKTAVIDPMLTLTYHCSEVNGTYPTATVRWWNSNVTPCPADHSTWVIENPPVQTQLSCPAGYSLSGSSCNLSDAESVQKPADSQVDISMSEEGDFELDESDPDAATVGSGVVITSGGKAITIRSGTNSVRMSSQEDGTLHVTKTTGNGDGTSTQEVYRFGPANSGAADGGRHLLGASVFSVQGESVDDTVGGGTSGGEGGGDCAHCATEATQQRVLGKLGEISSLLKNDDAQGKLDEATAAIAAHSDYRKGHLESLGGDEKVTDLGFAFPNIFDYLPTRSCSAWTLEFQDWSRELDWCDTLARARELWGWLLAALTALYVFKSATAAPGGKGGA